MNINNEHTVLPSHSTDADYQNAVPTSQLAPEILIKTQRSYSLVLDILLFCSHILVGVVDQPELYVSQQKFMIINPKVV